ncbi:MAG: pyridoxamine 5'-phosphate oxidase family protein [Dehalococcoidales bacterium]|nr:MAG: pyridoxamine 5'-phosphate oxidase family protein [Dehalococcoidales bacterium]
MDKKEILEFLNTNRTSHLATMEDGAPRVRAIGIVKADEDGILFQTWRSKDVGKQLEQNPDVEFCFNNYEQRVQLRVRGKVEPVEDTAMKEKFLEQRPNFQKLVDEGQELVLYSLKNGLAHVWTFQKNFEPKTFVSL